MRRGESKAKGLKRGGRTRAAEAKARAGRKNASSGSLAIQLAAKTRELNEALAQQAATAEIFRVISDSPGDAQPVFDAMLEQATRVCDAKFGGMLLQEGGAFRSVAEHNVPFALAELMRHEPSVRSPPDSPLDRMARTKQIVHVADVREEPAYIRGAAMVRMADAGRRRTIIPMCRCSEKASLPV